MCARTRCAWRRDGSQDHAGCSTSSSCPPTIPRRSNLTADLKYSLPRATVATLAQHRGLASAKGPAGSLLFFHPNLVHASSNNVSPFSRRVAFVTYNSVHNVPRAVAKPRPEFLASRDATPIVVVDDDALSPSRLSVPGTRPAHAPA